MENTKEIGIYIITIVYTPIPVPAHDSGNRKVAYEDILLFIPSVWSFRRELFLLYFSDQVFKELRSGKCSDIPFPVSPYRNGLVRSLPFTHNQHVGNLAVLDRKSTRLNSSHVAISYAVFCLKKKI